MKQDLESQRRAHPGRTLHLYVQPGSEVGYYEIAPELYLPGLTRLTSIRPEEELSRAVTRLDAAVQKYRLQDPAFDTCRTFA